MAKKSKKKAARKTVSPKKEKKPAPKQGKPTTSQKKKTTPIGRTVRTKDKFLPYDEKKVQKLKESRWVAVIDKNTNEELAVVRLTDEEQKNTTLLKGYKKGNKKKTYFKHFVEIMDKEGNPIKIDGVRFIENDKKNDLSSSQIEKVKDKVMRHSHQSQVNQAKIKQLHKKNPRD